MPNTNQVYSTHLSVNLRSIFQNPSYKCCRKVWKSAFGCYEDHNVFATLKAPAICILIIQCVWKGTSRFCRDVQICVDSWILSLRKDCQRVECVPRNIFISILGSKPTWKEQFWWVLWVALCYIYWLQIYSPAIYKEGLILWAFLFRQW